MRTLKKRIKQFIKDLCWVIFSILLIIFIGTPLFIYSYGDRLTSKGFIRFSNSLAVGIYSISF